MGKISFKSILIILFFGFSISCEKNNEVSQNIELGFNDIYYNSEYDFSLQIDSITSDSRCPIDAVCIWAGNAQVRFKLISQGNHQYLFNLNLPISY